jgi:hypothetical protein
MLPNFVPAAVAEKQGASGIYVWECNCDAWELMKFLGLVIEEG